MHMFLQATLKGDVFQVFIATGSLGKTITNDVLLLILKANLKLKKMPLRRKKVLSMTFPELFVLYIPT